MTKPKRHKEQKPEKEIGEAGVQVFYESAPTAKRHWQVRRVVWVVNGVEQKPRYERREIHVKADGSRRIGKAQGLYAEDLRYIVEHWGEIEMFFE
jgi:hypothetical protein